jgi:hypothetical protein
MMSRIVLAILTGGLLLSSLPQEALAQKNNKNNNKNVHVNRNVQTNKNVHVNRNANVNRNVKVNNKTVVNRKVVVKKTVYVKPYRAWGYRPYYGTIIGGVALGTVIGVSAAYAAPVVRPAPNLCWYWADPAGYRGYWDYCTLPY